MVSNDRERLSEATARLRQTGLVNPEQLIRLCAAAAADRCLAVWDGSRLDVLAQMLRQGGPGAADRRAVSERARILGEMNLWAEGYRGAS